MGNARSVLYQRIQPIQKGARQPCRERKRRKKRSSRSSWKSGKKNSCASNSALENETDTSGPEGYRHTEKLRKRKGNGTFPSPQSSKRKKREVMRRQKNAKKELWNVMPRRNTVTSPWEKDNRQERMRSEYIFSSGGRKKEKKNAFPTPRVVEEKCTTL